MKIQYSWLLFLSLINRSLFTPINYSKIRGRDILDKNTLKKSQSSIDSENTINKSFVDELFEFRSSDSMIKQAKQHLDSVIKIHGNNLVHEDIADAYNNLGNAYKDKSIYEKAIEHYNKALEIFLKLHNDRPNHPDIASTYVNLGSSRHLLEEEQKIGITKFKKDLKVKLANYKNNPIHQEIVQDYCNLGMSYIQRKDYDQAIDYLSKGMLIRRQTRVDKEDDFDAAFYLNLGNAFLFGKQKSDDAIIYYKKALLIQKKTEIGKGSDFEAYCYYGLGYAYYDNEEYDDAITYLNKALTIWIQSNKESVDNEVIASTYFLLGGAYCVSEEYSDAIECCKAALEMRTNSSKEDSDYKTTIDIYNMLAGAYSALGKNDDAIENYKKVLSIQHREFKDDLNQQAIAETYTNLANAFYGNEKYDDAINYFNKALTIHQNLEQDVQDNQTIASIYASLAGAFYNNEKYDDAIDQYNKSLEILERIQEDRDIHLESLSHVGLAHIYRNKGELNKASKEFIKAISLSPENITYKAEYAHFLIATSESNLLGISDKEISQYLYSVITDQKEESSEFIYYTKQDKNFVCSIFADIMDKSNTPFQINPKSLAYYLLLKHNQYLDTDANITVNNSSNYEGDTISHIFKLFGNYSLKARDEVSLRLLEDIKKDSPNLQSITFEESPLTDFNQGQKDENAENDPITTENPTDRSMIGSGLSEADEQ